MSTPTNEKKLFLLDAYALIFRAYYAFIKNPRYNTKGLNTSAVLGFTNSLDEILRKEKPSHIAVVFDPPGPTFRNEMFKEYKANRDETPEDIKKSVPYIKQVIKGFNIPVIEAEGFEADDTIGTLAKQAEKEGFTVYMVTPDKDFGQLVSDNIFMYKPKRGGKDNEILGKKEICELYGIEQPEQVIDILSIWGDAADNIPGIKGIGKKTSKKLIAKFGSTEELFKNSHLLKGKQKENVEDSEEKIKLSKILVTIRTDVPVNFDAKMYTLDSPNKQELLSLFEELEFRALSTRIFPNETTQSSTVSNSPQQQSLFGNSEKTEEVVTSGYSSYNDKKHSYSKVETAYEIEELKDKLLKQKEFSFDTETTSINALQAELVGISFAWEENKAYYIPFPEDREAAMEILAILTPVFENHTILKIGQNLKYDYTVLRNYNIRVAGPLFDTMIAHYLIDTNGKHNLTALSKQYLNYEPIEIESLTGKKVKEGAMRRADPDKVSIYAGEDSDLCLKLKPILWDELEKNNLRKP
ncbi:MAG: 5'-3' exonuclease H3TH domain-containing protein, partial [Bacteroidota bacterium]|nr:5'-3' exonuclease H3TH domain-containing protein [Bacteroidota bacterium]